MARLQAELDKTTYGKDMLYFQYKIMFKSRIDKVTKQIAVNNSDISKFDKLIDDINTKGFNVTTKFEVYEDNIDFIKVNNKGNNRDDKLYFTMLQGYYSKRHKLYIETKLLSKDLIRYDSNRLSKFEFKYLLELYNVNMKRAVLSGYKNFSLGKGLGVVRIKVIDNKAERKSVDWDLSKALKKELLSNGKELYDAETGIGEKWIIHHGVANERDAMIEWVNKKPNGHKHLYHFKPSHNRPGKMKHNGSVRKTYEVEKELTFKETISLGLGFISVLAMINRNHNYYLDIYDSNTDIGAELIINDFKLSEYVNV